VPHQHWTSDCFEPPLYPNLIIVDSLSPDRPVPPQLLAQVIDLAEDAIISVDLSQRIVLFNQGAEQIFGYTAQEAIGKTLDILIPERLTRQHRAEVADFAKSPAAARRKSERAQISGRRKDGTEFPAEASISKVDSSGQILLTVILRDISQRVADEEKLRASIREKEALLREIHHRVKNNLQVVSSLLQLQARHATQPHTRQAFQDSQGRIHSMALIHDLLCNSPELSHIDGAGYVRQLADYQFRTHGIDGNRIRLAMDAEPAHLNLEAAVPYGLIANELLTNTLRHAFPDERAGEIRITLRSRPENHVYLSVQDDGVGLPAGFDWSNATSLGFRLVRMLADQLKAKLDVHPRNPTAIELVFASG
jgi:two-component system, sensor histidine kinase PdtaS